MYKFPKIPFKTHLIDNGFQTWVKRVYLYDDRGLEKLGDWSIGFYFCEHCGVIEGFSFNLPPANEVSKEAHNSWVRFLHAHCHGDGRAILFEQPIQ